MENIKMWATSEDQVKSILNYFAARGYKVDDWYYESFKDSRAFFAYENGNVTREPLPHGTQEFFNKHPNKEMFFATPVKPPLGLRPRRFPESERTVEICEAVIRYAQAYKEVPKEWLDELYDLNVRWNGEGQR